MNTKSDTSTRRGFRSRAAGWAASRVSPGWSRGRASENIGKSFSEARQTMTVEKIDRDEASRAYHGRYKDGGRERFAEMVDEAGLTKSEVDSMGDHHFVLSLIFVMASVTAMGASLLGMATASGFMSIMIAFTLFFVAVIFLGLAGRHDFMRWQIREMRFGGIKEYLDYRLRRDI